MVDTSRGYADLKNIFANNTNRNIHPQGLRDLIESVAHPVRGGGMEVAAVKQGPESFWVYSGQASPFPLSITNGVDTQTDIRPASDGVLHDPMGMIQSGTYVSDWFGETWGPGSWFRVGLGIWIMGLVIKWAANAVGDREASIGLMDDRQAITGIDPFWWAPYAVENISSTALRVPATNLTNGFQVSQSFTAVTPEMLATSDAKSNSGDGIAYGLNVFQNKGSAHNIEYMTLAMVKIGALPVSA